MNEQPPDQTVHPTHHRTGGWIGGTMLIILGLLLLLQNLTGFSLKNWWALFILLPAAGAFTAAWSYQETGRISADQLLTVPFFNAAQMFASANNYDLFYHFQA